MTAAHFFRGLRRFVIFRLFRSMTPEEQMRIVYFLAARLKRA